jgi:hypothetical protein
MVTVAGVTVTNQQLLKALQDLAALEQGIASNDPQLQAIKNSAQNFVATATAALPRKADGTPYSDDDFAAIAAGNHAVALDIIATRVADDPSLAPPPPSGAGPS